MTQIEYVHKKSKKVFISNSEVNEKAFQKLTEVEVIASGLVYSRDHVEPFDSATDPIFKIESDLEGQDAKALKKAMKAAAKGIGYNNLKPEQVKKLTEYKAIPISESIKRLSIDEIIDLETNKRDCAKSWDKAFTLLSSVISLAELMPIIESIKPLIENYKSYSIQGKGYFNYGDDEDTEGLLNFIKSDSTFTGKGFIEQTFTPRFGMNKANLQNRLVKILE